MIALSATGCAHGRSDGFEDPSHVADPTLVPPIGDDAPGIADGAGKAGSPLPVAVDAEASPRRVEVVPGEPVDREVEIQAELSNVNAEVADVRLRFRNAPIEVPLSRESDTQWRGFVSERQLRLLAIEGKRMRYVGDIVSTNAQGRSSMGRKPVVIEVTAPSG